MQKIQRVITFALLTAVSSVAQAQFAWPKAGYHDRPDGLYQEDPFIVEYRMKFFSVFKGDFATFEKAYTEIQGMLKKNPKDARALVWLGNGQTIKAGLAYTKGNQAEARSLIKQSSSTLDRAVSLRPKDPNIYMMRAATLYVQGQYFPKDWLPKANWETLRDDCLRFVKFIGPQKMPKVSIHLRGETYGELGIAYLNLGETSKARAAFEKVLAMNPGTAYADRAKKELEKLKAR